MNNSHNIPNTKSNRPFELIPSIEQLENNLEGIYNGMPSNFQFSADNGYSKDENTTYLEEKWLDGYISTRKLSRKEKKYNVWEKPFQKDKFTYDAEVEIHICPLGEILYRRRTSEYKNKPRIIYWTNECKNGLWKKFAARKRITKQFQTMKTLPKLECNGKSKQNGHKKSTKNDQKQQNYYLLT